MDIKTLRRARSGQWAQRVKGTFAMTAGQIAEQVLETRRLLRLGDYENLSYPLALKRILGMEPMPPVGRVDP